MPLDALDWPLGRPERLARGTVADMEPADHLLTYPRTRDWFAPRGDTRARVSLMIVEPDAIHRKHLLLARALGGRYHRILTKSPGLLAARRNARRFVFGWSMIADPGAVDCTKSRTCSLIASAKEDQEGHRLRHRLARAIRAETLPVDIMGRGYRAFGAKEEGLAPYRFSVIVENVREPSYITEKLIDCLICRTIPIYWGAPDVGDFFDTSGIILCDDEAAILAALRDLSEDRYRALAGAVETNRARALDLARTEARAARLVLED